MRLRALLPAWLLTACSGAAPPAGELPDGKVVECAPGGSDTFDECRLVRDGAELVVYHRGGGFRRLRETEGGFATSDGADEVIERSHGSLVELTVGDDRYRWRVP